MRKQKVYSKVVEPPSIFDAPAPSAGYPDPAVAPGHTDMMVTPEHLDSYLAANPPPTSDAAVVGKVTDEKIKSTCFSFRHTSWGF